VRTCRRVAVPARLGCLANRGDVPDGDVSRTAGVARSHPGFEVRVRLAVEMKPQLLGDLGVEGIRLQPASKRGPDPPQGAHVVRPSAAPA
jgi:hypothetical protein